MLVEECCQHLLRSLLPDVDPQREGIAFDVGVGTFSFFCQTFAKLGYRTIAVEPLPADELKQLCKRERRIKLIESALSDTDGTATLYIGSYEGEDNYNLNSLHSDWWGSSAKTKQVSTITLPTLLEKVHATKLTCMKIDVEGTEQTIMSQFLQLPETQLPSVVMFEFGGGAQRQAQAGGWSPAYIASTMACLGILKQCGYADTIVVESADTQEHVVDLQAASLTEGEFFKPSDVYGNFIAFRHHRPDQQKIRDICSQYARKSSPPKRFAKLLNFARRLYDQR